MAFRLQQILVPCSCLGAGWHAKTARPLTVALFQRRLLQSDQTTYKNHEQQTWKNRTIVVGALGITAGIAAYYSFKRSGQAWASYWNKQLELSPAIKAAGGIKIGLPTYTLAEVQKHDTADNRMWVTYRNGVYDITDFLPLHPGADKINMAAGGPVEPFWAVYAIHECNEDIQEILEKYRIGNLEAKDVLSKSDYNSDPFDKEPERHKMLIPCSVKPYNAETPLHILKDNFITPNELFFVRNHMPVPDVDIDKYEVDVSGVGISINHKTLTLEDIKKFPKHSVIGVLQCGGNRMAEMTAMKATKRVDWSGGAIGNAKWSGARLYDVLKTAGLNENDTDAVHVHFEGMDIDPGGFPYAASIPIEKAMDPRGDVLLAYEMNDKPLSKDNGFPVRVFIPGVAGARNVKWLSRIVVSNEESDAHWQQTDYKCFSPSVDWDTADFSKMAPLQSMPVTSLICEPTAGDVAKLKSGEIEVSGYAWSGNGQKIIRVDLTADGGKTWCEAKLVSQDAAKPPRHWAWTLWTGKVKVPSGQKEVELWCKAVDSSHNTQPESVKNIWNLRGLACNSYHRVAVKIEATEVKVESLH